MAAIVSLSLVSFTARSIACSGSLAYLIRINRLVGTVSRRKAPEYQSSASSSGRVILSGWSRYCSRNCQREPSKSGYAGTRVR